MSYDGTVQGAVTFSAAKFSNGASGFTNNFDGKYVTLPTGLFNLGESADWTIEAWLKASTSGLWVALGSSTNNAVWMGADGGNFVCSVNGTGGFATVMLQSYVSATDGNWHHVAMVMTGGASLSLFVDGELKNTATGGFASPGASATGAIGNFPVSPAYAWPGQIDEVAFWDSAKYTGSFSVPMSAYTGEEAGLRALYHLEADGTDSKTEAPPVVITAATPVIGEYGPATVALSWAAATGGTAPYTYQVQRAPDSSGSPGTFANTGASQSGLTFTDTGLSGSTKYWWRVIATDANTDSGTSGNATKTTLATGTKYNRLDGTGAGTSRDVMVLVPNANAAIPYAGATTPLLMYHGGAGEDETALLTDALKATTVEALIDAGYICCGVDAGSANWGNQTACDAYPDLYKFVNDRYSLSNVLILSQSMGGLTGLLSLSQHKVPNVVAWAGIYPVCSLAAIYAAGAFAGQIDTAYSCTSTTYAAKTNGHDPCLKWGKAFRNVWMRFYASEADGTVDKTDNTDAFQALVASSSPESTIVVCTGNHGDTSHFQPADLVAFYERALTTPPTTSGLGGGVNMPRVRVGH